MMATDGALLEMRRYVFMQDENVTLQMTDIADTQYRFNGLVVGMDAIRRYATRDRIPLTFAPHIRMSCAHWHRANVRRVIAGWKQAITMIRRESLWGRVADRQWEKNALQNGLWQLTKSCKSNRSLRLRNSQTAESHAQRQMMVRAFTSWRVQGFDTKIAKFAETSWRLKAIQTALKLLRMNLAATDPLRVDTTC